mmetsp:Transcript_20834/g.52812  ORF Transcript_20834/g.52812 Transcript_20834/m.52812 type:complete len:201 (-) Transcript_20834:256-858(-)
MYRQEIHGRVPAVSAAMLPVVNLGRVSSEAAQGVCASHLPCHLGLARCWCQCRCRHSPRWHVERRRHRRERLQGLFHGGGAAQHRRRRGGTDGRTGWRWAFQRLFACFGKRARSRVLRGRPRHGHATGCVPIRHVGRPAAAAAAGGARRRVCAEHGEQACLGPAGGGLGSDAWPGAGGRGEAHGVPRRGRRRQAAVAAIG